MTLASKDLSDNASSNNMKNPSSEGKKTERERAKRTPNRTMMAPPDGILTGWPRIAKYLGQPVAVAQRWAKQGMPVERKGWSMTAKAEELNKWLGKEARTQAPVHIAQTSDEDLTADLRRGLKEARGAEKK
jgi:hypothetical protein